MSTHDHTTWTSHYGPWAVVTGASDGIGRAIAQQLAEAGMDLVLVARRRPELEELALELHHRHRVATRVVTADLADPAGVEAVFRATDGLDVGLLVAAAGFGTSGPFLQASLDTELQMLDVNARAVTAMAHGFGRRFAARGRGGIVLMSSLVAFQGVPGAAHYAATKAYVQTLGEGLHAELKPHGVDVLCSAPGPTRSGFAARADMQMGLAQGAEQVARGTLRALGKRMTVRPGWLAKFLEYALKLPRALRVAIMRRVMGGMIRHQEARALPPAKAA